MKHQTQAYLSKIPKAELHLHLEGSVTPQLLLQLSKKYQTDYQTYSLERLAEELFEYADFSNFLDSYRIVCEHLRNPEDYLLILDHLAGYFRQQGIRYAEVIITPTIPNRSDRDGEKVLKALFNRTRQIESEDSDVRIRWILDCVRQWGPEWARLTAEWAVRYRDQGVVALGLGGDERSLPMSDFEEIFTWAKANQLFIHIHAGEIGGPDQVWDAVRVLGANRIGHGVQAGRDARLMEYLREHAIGLDVCLTSNLKTGAWSRLSTNPFGLLLKRGVPVSINTDDPGMFGTSLIEELHTAATAFNLTAEEVHRLVLQGLRSAFLPHDQRMLLMQQFTDEIHRLG